MPPLHRVMSGESGRDSDQAGIDRLALGLEYDSRAGRGARFRCSEWQTRRARLAALRWCRRSAPTAGSPSRSHGEVDSDRHFGRVRLLPPTLEATMQTVADRPEAPTAIRTDLGAIFVSLELSRSTWLITSLSPGGGEKMSKQVVRGGDVAGLLERFARLREKARAWQGLPVRRHSGGWPRRILDRS